MSTSWLTESQADRLLTLTQDMAELISCLADDIDEGFRPPGAEAETSASAPERALLERFNQLWAEIEQGLGNGQHPLRMVE